MTLCFPHLLNFAIYVPYVFRMMLIFNNLAYTFEFHHGSCHITSVQLIMMFYIESTPGVASFSNFFAINMPFLSLPFTTGDVRRTTVLVILCRTRFHSLASSFWRFAAQLLEAVKCAVDTRTKAPFAFSCRCTCSMQRLRGPATGCTLTRSRRAKLYAHIETFLADAASLRRAGHIEVRRSG